MSAPTIYKVVDGIRVRWSHIKGDWVPVKGSHPQKVLKPRFHSRVRRPTGNRSILRTALAEAQNWRCCYCGEICENDADPEMKWSTIEHVIELSKGGSDDWENLVMACYDCNDERGNKMTAEEFYLKKQHEKGLRWTHVHDTTKRQGH